MTYQLGDHRKTKAWGGGNSLPKRLKHWAPAVQSVGTDDGPFGQISDDMIEAAERIAWLERQIKTFARDNVRLRKR